MFSVHSGASYLKENGKPIDARKFGYDISVRQCILTYRLWEEGQKKLIRLGKEVLEMYIAFCFGTKLTSLGATDRIARAKF